MADAGQGVIFGKDRDFGAAFAEARRIGGGETEGSARDGEVGLVERGCEDGRRLGLVEGTLGLMDFMADGEKLRRHGVDRIADFAFQGGGVGHFVLPVF